MPYARIDDQMHAHPKVLRLLARDKGHEALGLWVLCLSYASNYLTDGDIHSSVVIAKGGTNGVELAGLLVESGLWATTEDGWRFHDYLDHQHSKAEVLEFRAQKAEAGRRGGVERSRRQADAKQVLKQTSSTAQADSKQSSSNIPIPIPIPIPKDPDSTGTQGSPSVGQDTRKQTGPEPEAPTVDAVPEDFRLVPVANGRGKDAAAMAIELVEARFRSYGHILRPSAKSPHRAHIRARLLEGWTADELALAVDGNHADEWHAKAGKHELVYVLRNSEQVARFVEVARRGSGSGKAVVDELKRQRIIANSMKKQEAGR